MIKQDLIDKISEVQTILDRLPLYEDDLESDEKLLEAWQICEDTLVNYKIEERLENGQGNRESSKNLVS